jgi:hypothetical protein
MAMIHKLHMATAYWGFIAIAIAATIAFALLTQKDVFELQCNLTGKSGPEGYAFHVEIPKYLGSSRIVMIGVDTLDLKVWRLDKTKISAGLDRGLDDWPGKADLMSFGFNRITGGARIDYLRNPTDAEQKAPNAPFPGSMLVLQEFSKAGTCVKSKTAF